MQNILRSCTTHEYRSVISVVSVDAKISQNGEQRRIVSNHSLEYTTSEKLEGWTDTPFRQASLHFSS